MTAPIEAVLLDVGGVFLLPEPRVLLPALRAAGADPDNEALARAHYAGIAAMDEAGPDWDIYRATLAICAGVPRAHVPAAAAELGRLFRSTGESLWSRVVPGSIDALRRLADAGVALGVVSNAAGTIAELLVAGKICQVGTGEGVPVTVVVDSHLVGMAKPDPRIFAIALAELGVAPEHAVHVGDTAHADVEGALAAGVRPLHLDPYGDCPYADGHHEHVRSLDDVVGLVARQGEPVVEQKSTRT